MGFLWFFGVTIGFTILFVIIWGIGAGIKGTADESKYAKEHQDTIESEKKQFNKYKEDLKKQIDNSYCQYFQPSPIYQSLYLSSIEIQLPYIGKTENEIHLFKVVEPTPPNVADKGEGFSVNVQLVRATPGRIEVEQKFDIDDIIYYTNDGSTQYVSNVNGGGSSLKGAVVGGLVAGAAGAVIGSRKKVETTVSERDTRETIIMTKSGEERIHYKYYEFLTKLIPEKEFTVVQLNSYNNAPKLSVADELKDFKDLLDKGIITQEEFEAKKKELLGL